MTCGAPRQANHRQSNEGTADSDHHRRSDTAQLPIDYSRGCITFGNFISLAACTKYFIFSREPRRTGQQRIPVYSGRIATPRIQPLPTLAESFVVTIQK